MRRAMLRRDRVNRLANFALNELQRIAPANAEVKVEVRENPDGHCFAQLKVLANHKVFFAKKEGDSLYESFHKAMKAIKAQLIREKKNFRMHEPLKYHAA
jgi:ribosome-associated translation inhibitor RaiA